ncbi:hypothetical protein L798_04930 [Zootermopsis nevadensis]|uniref:Uncharacterized protein n=1 Tax=Zootermopsis nevadensis TaxID=136037 RepID=A0A067R9M8_ZOONE|nr:hypothetical protein L798_04930 [Zootermopsis nevadensis]
MILKVWIFNRQPQEVQNALILCPATDMLTNFIPVILVQLQTFQEQQRLLFCPLAGHAGRCLVTQCRRFPCLLIKLKAKVTSGIRVSFLGRVLLVQIQECFGS